MIDRDAYIKSLPGADQFGTRYVVPTWLWDLLHEGFEKLASGSYVPHPVAYNYAATTHGFGELIFEHQRLLPADRLVVLYKDGTLEVLALEGAL